ncbi:MAG TPA: hypothetical protein PL096_03040 [Micropepsaceae bacterium]|nr:hypothetical protein [Micropepsaceae bacterium]
MVKGPGKPFDPIAYYNDPARDADFAHWSRCARWTLEEGVALSLGKDPQQVRWSGIKHLVGSLPLAKEFGRRMDLTQRAAEARLLATKNSPGLFLGWANRIELDVPVALIEHVTRYGQVIADWPEHYRIANERATKAMAVARQAQDQQRELTAAFEARLATEREKAAKHAESLNACVRDQATEISTLREEIEALRAAASAQALQMDEEPNPKVIFKYQRLVVIMARRGYAYNPSAPRSKVPAEIVEDGAKIGIPIDDGTVRSTLREAVAAVRERFPDVMLG